MCRRFESCRGHHVRPARTPRPAETGDIALLSDRLIDGLTAWDDLDAIVVHCAADADQVVVPMNRLSKEWQGGWAKRSLTSRSHAGRPSSKSRPDGARADARHPIP
ncbi:hypothetical protein ACQEVB_04525 [Pseudonocardia sp. CA-107938]|uniref:hypothetical protein n=1 Tax=Pseudonocardia sp. CA-107938 TaxID=3240021 RepID=UPI003D8F69C7